MNTLKEVCLLIVGLPLHPAVCIPFLVLVGVPLLAAVFAVWSLGYFVVWSLGYFVLRAAMAIGRAFVECELVLLEEFFRIPVEKPRKPRYRNIPTKVTPAHEAILARSLQLAQMGRVNSPRKHVPRVKTGNNVVPFQSH
jgi:hypothetical protein|tara:strand:- start:49536 stop:49952 length:417 start_codon:yes stop_codon:yes gene_type:complete